MKIETLTGAELAKEYSPSAFRQIETAAHRHADLLRSYQTDAANRPDDQLSQRYAADARLFETLADAIHAILKAAQ